MRSAFPSGLRSHQEIVKKCLGAIGAILLLTMATRSMGAGPTWETTRALGHTRTIDFSTDEGTWMSVSVSSDAHWIVFDLLGHVYRLPMSGGSAEALTQDSGSALNVQPRFSPDGHTIAFVSDRSGQNNLWLMDSDGRNVRPLLLDPKTRFTQPTWTADGKAIIAVRHTPTMDGMHRRVASLWWIPLDDNTVPKLLAESKEANYYDPSISADGRSLFFMAAYLLANRFGTESQHTIQRLDLVTGKIEDVIKRQPPERMVNDCVLGGTTQGYAVMAPTVSPNGRYLAYGRQNLDATVTYRGHQFGPRTELWLRDLTTRQDHRLLDQITLDLAGAHAMFSLSRLPMFSWSADNSTIFISLNGKIHSVDVETGNHNQIPFIALGNLPISWRGCTGNARNQLRGDAAGIWGEPSSYP